jgi:hypothetical protein
VVGHLGGGGVAVRLDEVPATNEDVVELLGEQEGGEGDLAGPAALLEAVPSLRAECPVGLVGLVEQAEPAVVVVQRVQAGVTGLEVEVSGHDHRDAREHEGVHRVGDRPGCRAGVVGAGGGQVHHARLDGAAAKPGAGAAHALRDVGPPDDRLVAEQRLAGAAKRRAVASA